LLILFPKYSKIFFFGHIVFSPENKNALKKFNVQDCVQELTKKKYGRVIGKQMGQSALRCQLDNRFFEKYTLFVFKFNIKSFPATSVLLTQISWEFSFSFPLIPHCAIRLKD